MINVDEGSAPMVIVLKENADAIRQCSRKLVGEVRDAAGRRVQITRSGSVMSENRTDVYGYNERGELISAAKNAESAEIEENEGSELNAANLR